MYYGEELGMENTDPTRKEDVKDPIGVLGWPLEKGRDGERTPMQWTSGENAGFTTGKPWLPVPASAKTHNVETESKQADSVLSFYKRVLKLRREEPAFREGKYVGLNESDANVVSYLRQSGDETILVVVNMSGTKQQPSFDLSKQGLAGAKSKVLAKNATSAADGELKTITLDPYGVYVAKIVK
jgi:alpha-glucosidase